MAKKLFSKDIKIERGSLLRIPANRGPMTCEGSIDDGKWLLAHATPEELKTFRASVEARRNLSKTEGWRVMPGGSKQPADLVLLGCVKCGRWMWGKPGWASSFCPVCNISNRTSGGHLRAASPAEEEAWLKRETAAVKKWREEAPKRQAEVDAFNRRHLQDKGIGR